MGKLEGCVAFLVNHDTVLRKAIVEFGNSSYELPPTSISILPNCTSEAFNTAKASSLIRLQILYTIFILSKSFNLAKYLNTLR